MFGDCHQGRFGDFMEQNHVRHVFGDVALLMKAIHWLLGGGDCHWGGFQGTMIFLVQLCSNCDLEGGKQPVMFDTSFCAVPE